MPQKFEAGTPNYPGIASLCAGIQFIGHEGLDAIKKKSRELTESVHTGAAKRTRRSCSTRRHPIFRSYRSISGTSKTMRAVTSFLKAYNIIIRTGLHCAPLVHGRIDGGKGCVRVSFSHLTTPEECRLAADAVREVAEDADC